MKLAGLVLAPRCVGSPPTRGRGLKHDPAHWQVEGWRSPPTRGRGLKLRLVEARLVPLRRPPRGGVD